MSARLRALSATAVATLVSCGVASAAIIPGEGDRIPLQKFPPLHRGEPKRMLAGPFTGPCELHETGPVPSEANKGHEVGKHYTVFKQANFSGVVSGSVLPDHACVAGLYGGGRKADEIYGDDPGDAQMTVISALEVHTCCGVSTGYYDKDEDILRSFQDTYTVHFKIIGSEPEKRFTDEEKKAFSQKSAALNVDGGAAAGVGVACLFTPEPAFSKACAVVAGLEAAALAVGSGAYGYLAADPVDRNFRIVPKPVRLSPPSAAGLDGISPGLASALDALQKNVVTEAANSQALITAINRSQGAHVARRPADEARQLTAAKTYARTVAAALDARAGLQAAVRDALVADGAPEVPVTGVDVAEAAHDARAALRSDPFSSIGAGADGVAPILNGYLRAFSPDAATLARATARLQDPAVLAQDTSLAALLTDPAGAAADRAGARALRSFAARRPVLAAARRRHR